MSEAIRFYHRGAIHQVQDVAPTRTVLQYLREDLHCSGTKEGCAEGDCGGMAATPQRAGKTEAALQGRRWTEATLQAASAMLADDYAPLSDLRASGGYRMKAAQNLLRRFWLETRTEAPLPPQAVNVFFKEAP